MNTNTTANTAAVPASLYYDRAGQPIGLNEWAEMFETTDRSVARDVVLDCVVSTVWMGLDHSFGDTDAGALPLVYETMVFGGRCSETCERYTSEADALAGHARMIELVRQEHQAWEALKNDEALTSARDMLVAFLEGHVERYSAYELNTRIANLRNLFSDEASGLYDDMVSAEIDGTVSEPGEDDALAVPAGGPDETVVRVGSVTCRISVEGGADAVADVNLADVLTAVGRAFTRP